MSPSTYLPNEGPASDLAREKLAEHYRLWAKNHMFPYEEPFSVSVLRKPDQQQLLLLLEDL